MNDDLIELANDLLVEEGHYLEKVQEEALEEAFLYHTIRDFESLLQTYDKESILSALTEESKQILKSYLSINYAH